MKCFLLTDERVPGKMVYNSLVEQSIQTREVRAPGDTSLRKR